MAASDHKHHIFYQFRDAVSEVYKFLSSATFLHKTHLSILYESCVNIGFLVKQYITYAIKMVNTDVIRFLLAMSAEGVNQSLDMRPKHSGKIIAIFVIKYLRKPIPQIKSYLCNLMTEKTIVNVIFFLFQRRKIEESSCIGTS